MPPPQQPFNPNHLIRFNARCPVCASTFDLQHLRILGEREQQVLTYIDCAECGTAMVSVLSMSPNGMIAQGVVTDLSPEELIDVHDTDNISMNDVLAAHEFLEAEGQPLFPKKS